MGFPGIRLYGSELEKITGSVFTSNQLDKIWNELDDFEGEAYERRITTVYLPDETFAEVYIYALKLPNEN